MKALAAIIPLLIWTAGFFILGRLSNTKSVQPLKKELAVHQDFVDTVRQLALTRADVDPEFSTILLDELAHMRKKEIR